MGSKRLTDSFPNPTAAPSASGPAILPRFSTCLAAALERRGVHYGWVVAFVTFLVMLTAAGAMGAAGIIIEPLQKEFGWTNEEISGALAIRLVIFGLMGPFAAAFMNRFGLRRVVLSALLLIADGVAASLAMTRIWQLVLIWGFVIGFGTGMVALVLGATVATRWFKERRGLVIGMLTASNATGQLVFLPLLAKLSEAHGWRASLIFVAAMLVVATAIVALLMRDRPSEVGLAPYGARTLEPAPVDAGSLTQTLRTPLRALAEASGDRTFWVLFATFHVCGLSTNGLIQTHWIALCGDYGIAPVSAASALATIGAFDFFGTLLSGWLSDRFDNRWLLFVYYGMRGLSLVALPFTGFSVVGLSAFAVFYGLDWVATVPPTVRLTAERFGPERANLTFGWIFAAHQLGAATAAFGAGAARTELSTYLPALYVSGLACILIALAPLTLSRPRRLAPAAA
jgi:sugar phosphate permease